MGAVGAFVYVQAPLGCHHLGLKFRIIADFGQTGPHLVIGRALSIIQDGAVGGFIYPVIAITAVSAHVFISTPHNLA